jgi:hypothetical protein
MVSSTKKKIKLKEEHIQYLAALPESGMGYQIVDILLTNGQLLKNRIVLNSELLISDDIESIDPFSIEKIEIKP